MMAAAISSKTRALAANVERDSRWAAVVARDRMADRTFSYWETTGVYCRPSCGAPLARLEHVAFHATTDAARAAGFRPCKRCKPDEPPLLERPAQQVARSCVERKRALLDRENGR